MKDNPDVYHDAVVARDSDREIWTAGRRGSPACIAVTIYEHSVVATADAATITEAMMRRALRREFPEHTFYFSGSTADYLRCDADRWDDDNV
jgi:hypothetical protein